jgi:TolB protein
MNADVSDQIQLTNNLPGRNTFPNFSPDGSKIVFVSGRDGDNDIFVMNVNSNI